MMKLLVSLFLLVFTLQYTSAQSQYRDSIRQTTNLKFKYQSLLLPAIGITYGVVAFDNYFLKSINGEIQEELHEHIDRQFTIDDLSQYSPFLSVYALNALGIKGRHNFKDRTIILGTAYLLMGATVMSLKHWVPEERPDGSNHNSFPSGHTATAFMGAEFLWQEYKDVSVWYGIAGYTVAIGTGFFRMYNSRHWLTDVASGAGIGMLSTKIAYWIHPVFNKKKNHKEAYTSSIVLPFYNGQQYGISASITF